MPSNCLECGKPTKNRESKYCSNSCQQKFIRNQKIVLLEEGKSDFKSHFVKRYLIDKFGHQCFICKNSEWRNQPITLELDHIDGNAINSSLLNVRLLCPNCHSQTFTFKGKNRGNGRINRYKN